MIRGKWQRGDTKEKNLRGFCFLEIEDECCHKGMALNPTFLSFFTRGSRKTLFECFILIFVSINSFEYVDNLIQNNPLIGYKKLSWYLLTFWNCFSCYRIVWFQMKEHFKICSYSYKNRANKKNWTVQRAKST